MNKGTVCLTFDFDAISLWIARGLRTPGPISRGEFGAEAIPRLLRLLKNYTIPATWFIPGHTIETFPKECAAIVAEGHEVGAHGYLHEPVQDLTRSKEEEAVQRSGRLIEQLTGTSPKGFRAPSWDLTEFTLDILTEHHFLYDSSLMNTDYRPTFCRTGDRILQDGPVEWGSTTRLVEIPVSWSLDDYPQFEYLRTPSIVMPGLRDPETVFKNFTEDFRYMTRDFENGIMVVTFHPQVIGRGHRLVGLEKWVEELRDMGATFARMDEIARHFAQSVEFGIYRPTP